MNRIIGLFFLLLLVASTGLFFVKPPKNGSARKVVVFARVLAVMCCIAVFSSIIYLMSWGSLLGTTKDAILFEQESPNKLYTLTAFNRYGGATVNNTTVFSIRLKNETLDTKRNPILFRLNGIRKISAVWDGDKHLVIHYMPGEVFNQVTNWNGVNITYVESESVAR